MHMYAVLHGAIMCNSIAFINRYTIKYAETNCVSMQWYRLFFLYNTYEKNDHVFFQ